MQKNDYQILNRHEINTEKWNKIIEQSSHGQIYAYSWYLDIVSPNWKALVIKDYDAILPLTWRKKYGITYLFQPYFCQQLGLFGNTEYLNSVVSLLKKEHKHINIQLNHQNSVLPLKNNFVLHTLPDYEKLKLLYSGQTIRNLKKTEKYHFEIIKNTEFETSIQFFICNKHQVVEKLQQSDYSIFSKLCSEVKKYADLEVINVYSNQELISSAVFFENKNRTTLMMLSSSEKGKELLASTFLIDEKIKQLSNKNHILDFEGSSIEGLVRFYSGFGAVNEPFGTLYKSFFRIR